MNTFKLVFNPSPLLVLYSCYIPYPLWKSQPPDPFPAQYSHSAPSRHQETQLELLLPGEPVHRPRAELRLPCPKAGEGITGSQAERGQGRLSLGHRCWSLHFNLQSGEGHACLDCSWHTHCLTTNASSSRTASDLLEWTLFSPKRVSATANPCAIVWWVTTLNCTKRES